MVSIIFLVAENSEAQEKDSSAIPLPEEIIDPAQNRLFMMSTGRTMPVQKVSIGDFEIFLLQLGYAPTDYLHFNFSYFLPIGGESIYWSFGTKVQVAKPSGNFQGFSIGADVGFFDELFKVSSNYRTRLVSLNAAVSGGNEDLKAHLNLAHLVPLGNTSETSGFPTYLQLGTDIKLHKNASGGGMKFIFEMLLPFSKGGISGNILIVGMRVCGPKSVFDIGWPFAFSTGGAGASPVPFCSFCFVF